MFDGAKRTSLLHEALVFYNIGVFESRYVLDCLSIIL